LVSSLLASDDGSSRIAPSRLPRMFVEYQPSTFSARERNAGASTVLIRVWPVLPSLPATGPFNCSASSSSAGTSVKPGVKLTYGQPSVIAA
jgi:hypothetical protein